MPSTIDKRNSSGTRPYRDVRALTRGLKILEALSELGWATPSELHKHTGIDRGTIYRLLSTLTECGYVTRKSEDGRAGLGQSIRRLKENLRDDDLMLQIMAPHLEKLLLKVYWPSDLAILKSGILTIQNATHARSPWTFHRATIGKTRSLTRSALGLATLSALNAEELTATLELALRARGADQEDLQNRPLIDRMIKEVHARGYALSIGQIDENVSAIALPVQSSQRVLGALNVVFFRDTLSPDQAAEQLLPALSDCVRAIEMSLQESLAI